MFLGGGTIAVIQQPPKLVDLLTFITRYLLPLQSKAADQSVLFGFLKTLCVKNLLPKYVLLDPYIAVEVTGLRSLF